MPSYEVKFSILKSDEHSHRDLIAVEPLERGYGYTLGTALRRVMLSYLWGAAVTRLKINDVPHEFSPLKGVHEDVVELVQNLKLVNFKMGQKKVHIVTLDAVGEKEVTAGDLKCPTGIEVVNPDQHIVTLSDKKSKLKMELTVEYGQGYRLPEMQGKKLPGVILIDANFSPTVLTSYRVENTRVGRDTDLDRLVMDVTTNGSIAPREAIRQAAAILAEKFELLAGDKIKVYHPGDVPEEQGIIKPVDKPKAKVYLEELNLPTRVLNTLKKAGYETVDDLKNADEDKIRSIKNIGPKTVDLLLEEVDNLNR